MENHRPKIAATILAAYLLTGFGLSSAQANPPSGHSSNNNNATGDASRQRTTDTAGKGARMMQSVRVATADRSEQDLDRFQGRAIRGTQSRELGTLEDFIVKADSGKLAYAVVSSGGLLGIADTLRLVPADALRWDGNAEEFRLEVGEAQWQQVPTLDEQQYEAGNIVVSTQLRQQIHTALGLQAGKTDAMASDLLPASDIAGRAVHASGREIGGIDDLAIDLQNRQAMAIFDPEDDFVATEGRFLVSFAKLTLPRTDDDAPATTALTPSDFQGLSAQTAANDRPLPASDITGASGISQSSALGQTGYSSAQTANAASTDKTDDGLIDESNLSPTGRTDATASERASAEAAVRSIQEAIDNATTLAHAGVKASAEGDKVVLTGSVPTDALKDRAEEVAEGAASGVDVDNRLVVKQP